MSGRTILALLLAPIISGAVLAIAVMSTAPIDTIPIEYRPKMLVQFEVGVITGVLFELFVLLPLLYVLNRIRVNGRLLFICLGTTFWFVASVGLLSLTAQDWNSRIALSLMFLVPGVALVVAFGAIVSHGAKA